MLAIKTIFAQSDSIDTIIFDEIDTGISGKTSQSVADEVKELAKYMQIISPEFIKAYPNNIINIHHSFLPAFVGAKPYHAAFERGVKIIGATSHYVTEELDAGPIIKQDVARISHKDSIENLIRKGQDLEKVVLSRGVEKHIERKILVYKNKTIVFG